MKNTIIILAAFMLGITACEPIYEPVSNFDVSNTTVLPYENVYFYNSSKYANEYEWSFGDGDFTNSFEPVHYYTDPGNYQVRLSAYNHDRVDDSYMIIKVIEPAEMEITVVEYTDLYVVPNATVRLYPTLTDWVNETNMVTEGTTNGYGKVHFYDLFPGIYYMDIFNRNHNNYALKDDNVNFIKTEEAVSGYVVKFTAYVDYVTATSASINRNGIATKSSKIRTYVKPDSELVKIEKTKK